MFQRLKAWLAAPVFPHDEQMTYQAMLLNSLVMSLFIALAFTVVGLLFIFPAKLPTGMAIGLLGFLLISCKTAINRGHLRGVGLVLVSGLWLITTVLVLFAGGTSNVNMVFYVAVNVIAALLFGRRGAAISIAVTLFATFWMVIAIAQGWMPPRVFPTPPQSGWFMLLFAMIATSTTLSLAIDGRDKALAEAKRIANEYRETLKALRSSEQKLQAIFNAARNVSLILYDVKGLKSRILEFSPGAEEVFGYRREEVIGERVAILHMTNDVARFLEIDAAMQRNRIGFDGEMTLVRKSGERFPALYTTYPLFNESKELTAALGVAVDLSELKRSQSREVTLSQGLRGVIAAVDELLRCEDLDALFRRGVELGREKLGLERCGFFILDEPQGVFLGTYGTDLDGNTTDEHQARMPFVENEHLLDSLWQILYNTTSHWDGDQVLGTEQHWSACTPITNVSHKLYGLLFNDAAITRAPINEAQQEIVAVYCSLLGSIIEQKQADAREREMRHGLEAIIAAADELMRCDDLDELYRRGVELGREKLGLERCGLFLWDEKQNDILNGTFGTDLEGHTTDERSARGQFLRDTQIYEPGGSPWKAYETHNSHWEADHLVPTDPHWFVATAIRSAARPLGVLFNDTAISHSPVNDSQQECVAVYCSLLGNIIERKRADKALLQASWIVENSPAIAFRWKAVAGSPITFVTENIGQWGYSPGELVGVDYQNLVLPEDWAHITELLAEFVEDGDAEFSNREYRLLTKDEKVRWVDDRSVAERDSTGKVTHYQGIVLDITDRKRAEADREKLINELETKNAELERFTYTVSHDLKAPLITIQGFLGYLERDAGDGQMERLRVDIARITDATTRMQRLLSDLLELSRIGRITNPPKHVPFELIVEEALRLVQGRLDACGIRVAVSDELPFVYGDSARLVEVVQNLVDNAAKFIGDQHEPNIEIGFQGRDPQGYVTLYVRDNGIGVAPQFHERIFGLFDKLDPKSDGTGVGLALVKRIVEVHGGKIWIESEGEESGSTFYFTLPERPM